VSSIPRAKVDTRFPALWCPGYWGSNYGGATFEWLTRSCQNYHLVAPPHFLGLLSEGQTYPRGKSAKSWPWMQVWCHGKQRRRREEVEKWPARPPWSTRSPKIATFLIKMTCFLGKSLSLTGSPGLSSNREWSLMTACHRSTVWASMDCLLIEPSGKRNLLSSPDLLLKSFLLSAHHPVRFPRYI